MRRRQLATLAIALGALGLVLACEAFVDNAWSPPPCCAMPCPANAQTGAVLVAPNGVVDGAACGTTESPCGSLAVALAQKGVSVVAIATGTYEETVELGALGGTVFLCGGYEPGTWSRGDASSSIIGTDTVAIDDPSSGPSCLVLDGLDIASKAQAAPGETLVGVYALRGAPSADLLCTRGVAVRAAAGSDGLDGDAGADGVMIACAGDAGANGANGTNGDAGAPAVAGYFDSTGTFIPGNGQPGTRGGDGLAGEYDARTCDECSYCVDSGGVPSAVEDAGMCSAGTSGCGGGGGGAGGGGRGGGASAAMVVVKLHVAMSNTTLSAQAGGRGGRGAPGGVAASGGAGTSGFCWACNINGDLFDSTANGGKHDDGGNGGNGGTGANGAGGWSCALVVDDVAQDGGLAGAVLQFAEAGAGDPSGQAAAICHTP